MKLMPLSAKQPVAPKSVRQTPASAGPRTRVALKSPVFSAMALDRISGPTSSKKRTWRLGSSKVTQIRVIARIAASCQIWTTWRPTRAVKAKASAIWAHSMSRIIRKRRHPIGQGAGVQADEDAGQERRHFDDAEHELGASLLENQPAHGRGLEPAPDKADALPDVEPAKTRVARGPRRWASAPNETALVEVGLSAIKIPRALPSIS